ncbi:hypothetical protein LEM8419_01854 [Neolewinella maritima]|uniref:T9SS type A sorting domain-containing protein n=1 Tax=Neolewinella maritima TaxID=1383882 RepID=A0ABM9B0X7_9BACT|nr:SdrD B-like domain-containing protein [Neolewinella maritima]CAH1000727.1 hypothetical protein LEM8419_01854 [Neolewinella maritima]
MKLYHLCFTLLLPFFVAGQTIPYQLDYLDVNPDKQGADILELSAIGSRIYWGTEGDVNYLSTGSAESTFSFQGGVGLRDGIEPLGHIGNLYYFHYRDSNDRGYNIVVNAIVPIPEVLELPLLEDEKWTHTAPVMANEKLYAVRERNDRSTRSHIVQLIETDLATEASTIVVADTVTYSNYPVTKSMVADGDLVYYTRPQAGGVGPASYNASTAVVTDLGTFPSPAYLNYERVGNYTLLRYRQQGNYYGDTYFLTPTGTGDQIPGGILRDQSVALTDALVSVDTNGALLAYYYADGSSALLADLGTEDNDNPRLFQLTDDELLFYQLSSGGAWTVARTDGTTAGTRSTATLPNTSTSGPAQTVRLGAYVALSSTNQPVYIYDPRNDDLQEVAANFNLVGPNPPLASLGDRLYFAAIAPGRGEQLHYLTIDNQRTLSGTAFTDENGNGVQDTDETGIANLMITVEGTDGKNFLTTDSAGHYALAVLDGETYTVTAYQPDCYVRTTAADSYTVTVPTDPHQAIDFGYALQDGAADLTLYFSAGRVRCNTKAPFWITVRNDGCLPLAGTATVKLQDNVSFVSVNRDSVMLTDSTITFTFDTLQPGELYHNAMKLQMPSEDFAGDTIVLAGTAGASFQEGIAVTDTVNFETILRCAVDPNDKAVFPFRADSTHSNYTQAGETLRYTIRFENMGNDTAFAVRIEDQLSEHLDGTTLRPIEASHPYELKLSDQGLLTVNFPGIELVDSSVDAAASQGFVVFEIQPMAELPEMTRIENTAGIFFDFNRPVITNTVVSTIVSDLDKDDDGVYFWEDCDDNDASISPFAKEIPENDVDENCDGIIEKTVSTIQVLSGTLEVYPNPAGRWLQLRYSQSAALRATLVDATGRQLLTTSFTGELQLAVDRYPAGVYLLRVEDPATGEAGQRRIVLRGH